jgi:hypothetical protein
MCSLPSRDRVGLDALRFIAQSCHVNVCMRTYVRVWGRAWACACKGRLLLTPIIHHQVGERELVFGEVADDAVQEFVFRELVAVGPPEAVVVS